MPELQQLLKAYYLFNDRFKSGLGKWTPTKEDWLEHEEVGRKILLLAIQQYVPAIDPKTY